MSWKKFFVGEPMPDRNDPRYKERYEREVAAGAAFARRSGISWCAARLQSFGSTHKVLFLVLVFGFVITCFVLNVYRYVTAVQCYDKSRGVAVEQLDSALQHRFSD